MRRTRVLPLAAPVFAILACSSSHEPDPVDSTEVRLGAEDCPDDLEVALVTPGVPFVGSNGAECIVGTDEADVIFGKGGNDFILGGGGDDSIDGGNGLDTIYGGAGNDHIEGGNAPDVLYGERGDDTISGDKGPDTLDGGPGDDILSGGNGADTLLPRAGRDEVAGDNGPDEIVVWNACEVEPGEVLDGGLGGDALVSPGAQQVQAAGANLAGITGFQHDDSQAGAADCVTVDEPVGPEGGEVNTPDDKTSIVIPPGALEDDIVVTVQAAPEEDVDALPAGNITPIMEFGPEGVEFDEPVTIAIEAPQHLIDQVGIENLRVSTFENGEWVQVEPDPNYQGSPTAVSGMADHFSYWCVTVFYFCSFTVDAENPEMAPRSGLNCSVCGDGVVDSGEACDDGVDNVDGAGTCQLDCTCDSGYAFAGNGCRLCGDGNVDADLGENCDDGMANGPEFGKCSTTCTCDGDYDEMTYGGTCEYCGDGVLQPILGEQCDDGNAVDDDGCTNACQCEFVIDASTPDDEVAAMGYDTRPRNAACGCGYEFEVSAPEVSSTLAAGPESEVACCVSGEGYPMLTDLSATPESLLDGGVGCCCGGI